MDYQSILDNLKTNGNFRDIPHETENHVIDFSTNDYLGIAARKELQEYFLGLHSTSQIPMSASASRLLAATQTRHDSLETYLSHLYDDKSVLLFNSGYHANVGLLSALADRHSLVISDRLVHASIIDGIQLSRAAHHRFRHNDYDHLEKILSQKATSHTNIIVAVESIYSMDGDKCDIERLLEIKRKFPQILLYIDEAHAFGVRGDLGLGFAKSSSDFSSIDIVVGTFGKAGASVGAFAVMSPTLRHFAVNTARSFIFSTALPPLNIAWTQFIVERLATMDRERIHLMRLSQHLHQRLSDLTGKETPISHIQPVIIGDSAKAVEISRELIKRGLKVLPIRKPTVPAGTERLRISLSAAHTLAQVDQLVDALKEVL